MVTVRGDLAAWLSREWLSSRNLHGADLPESTGECDPHRAQLVTATGLTDGDDGDKLLWCELSDGDLWIDACISTTVVDHYNATTAIPFTASSRSKCLFALLSWRFVLSRPPVPQRTSPSKRRAAAASASAASEPKVELLSRRVCLRVDAFKHHALGEGSLVNERMKPFRRTTPGANGASAVSKEDEERVIWVRRVEEAGGVQQKKEENQDEQVTYVTDLPADPALRLAPRPSTSTSAAPAPPPPASALPSAHAPHARSDPRLPPYVPHPSWPADDAPMVSAPSREDMQACLRRAREEKLAKAGRASAGGAAAKSTAAPLRDAAPVAGGSRSSPPTTTKEEGAKPAWQPAPVDSAAMQACLAAAKAKAKPLQGSEPATPAAPAHGRSAQPAPASAPSASFAAAFLAPDQDALRATLTAARDKARIAKQRASLVPAAASAAATSSPSSTAAPGRKRPRESAPAEVGAWSSAAALLVRDVSTAPAGPSNPAMAALNEPSLPIPRETREDSVLSQALDGDEHAQYAASTFPPSSPPPSSPQKSPAQRTASPAATLPLARSSPHRTSPAPTDSAHSCPPASSAQTVRAREHSRSPAPPPSSLPALPIFDEDDADSISGANDDGAGAMMEGAQDAAKKTKGWPESAVKAFAPAPARQPSARPPAPAKRAPAPAQAQVDERSGKRVKLSQPQQQQRGDESLRGDQRPTTTTPVPRRKPLIPLDVWDFDAWKRSRQDRRTTL